nr:hypothetical protein [Mariniflexile sp.]
MQLKTYLTEKLPYLAIFSLVLGLYSCGSYQYVGVETDGIYSDAPRTVQYEDAVVDAPNNAASNNY